MTTGIEPQMEAMHERAKEVVKTVRRGDRSISELQKCNCIQCQEALKILRRTEDRSETDENEHGRQIKIGKSLTDDNIRLVLRYDDGRAFLEAHQVVYGEKRNRHHSVTFDLSHEEIRRLSAVLNEMEKDLDEGKVKS